MIKLGISSPDHLGGLHSTCSSLPMTFLYWGTPNWRQQHYRHEWHNESWGKGRWPGAPAFCTRSISCSPRCCWLILMGSVAGTYAAQWNPQSQLHALPSLGLVLVTGLGLCPRWMSWGSCRASPPGSLALQRIDCTLPSLLSAQGGSVVSETESERKILKAFAADGWD